MEELVNLAFDKLGYPHEDENPDDINHIIEYLGAPDTQTTEAVLNTYPNLFRDPVVLQVITLVRQYMVIPPEELSNPSHAQPAYPPATSPSSLNSSLTATSPIFGLPQNPQNPASRITDDKLFAILAAIADGSLTSMGYDYKTHSPVVLTPSINERMQAMKLLLEINNTHGTATGPQINILNNIPPAPVTPTAQPSSPTSPASTPPTSPASSPLSSQPSSPTFEVMSDD